MATTPTNKPIPSEGPRDLKFNAGKIDEEVNGSADYYTDRFSVQRLTNTGRNNQFQDAQTQRGNDFTEQMTQQADDWLEQFNQQNSDFQQFLLNSGYQFLGDYENGPYTITARNQIILYQNEFWRLNAATNPPYTTTGVNSTSWSTDVTHLVSVGDANLRQELAAPTGATLSGAGKGGTVEDYLFDISVDALGDFKNDQDGLAEALQEKITELTGMVDSAYVQGMDNFCSIRFPNGNFTLKELILPPGVDLYIPVFARIRPHPDGLWAIKTTGTAGVPLWQRLMYSTIYGGVFGDRWSETGDMPVGRGGVSMEFASYVRFVGTKFRYLKGRAFYGGEVFDFSFQDVSVIYCGYKPTAQDVTNGYVTSTDPIPCFEMNNAGGTDATNACRFVNFQSEANRVGMTLTKCRHINFTNPKIERDETSHLLQGNQGINFTDAILSFNSDDIPQFFVSEVTGAGSSDSSGVSFNAPKCQSSTVGRGWYFHHEGNAAVLEINNHYARGIKRLATGRRIKILGGSAYDCGPTMVVGDNNVTIDNVDWRALKATTTNDGTTDTVIFNGVGCAVRDSYMASQNGSATDGGAFINSTATSDTIVTGVTYGGSRQYGYRGALNQKVRNNKIASGANVGSLSNQAKAYSSLVNPNAVGFGVGEVYNEVYTLAAGATLSPAIIKGATQLTIRIVASSGTAAMWALADSSVTTMNTSIIGTVVTNTAGTPGDGLVHVYKTTSGATINLANYTANSVQIVITAISAAS